MSDNPQAVLPQQVLNFLSEEEQAIYNEQLAQLAAGKPVGLDGIGVIEATPPGQAVIPPEA